MKEKMVEWTFEFPDDAFKIVKENLDIHWSDVFAREFFKHLSKNTKFPEKKARKIADNLGKQMFKQIKEKHLRIT